ncbi:MAG: hypothetical protein ACYDDA_00615 [Acidiferrobacteraceae bacterium]
MNRSALAFAALGALFSSAGWADTTLLKPFVLGTTPPGNMAQVVSATEQALSAHGFQVVGSYSPYPAATVICATDHELETQAAKVRHGGFGVAERVAVTNVGGTLQVSYLNPAYVGTAYGLGMLPETSAALKVALGDQRGFGAKGMKPSDLKPGEYHYAFGMPYFNDVNLLKRYHSHAAAVAAINRNLAVGVAGVHKVYQVNIPGTKITVFGVAITKGSGADAHVMKIIDYKKLRSTAHLPYEMMVDGRKVIALRARYRIAVDFPDLTMFGSHGFTRIMTAPYGIKKALAAVAGERHAF